MSKWVEMQKQNYQHEEAKSTQGESTQTLWCKYQDNCNKRYHCPFKHYDTKFPHLPTNKPGKMFL